MRWGRINIAIKELQVVECQKKSENDLSRSQNNDLYYIFTIVVKERKKKKK